MIRNVILTDYKIQSVRIYRSTLICFSFIVYSVLSAELFFDLRSTTLQILVPPTTTTPTVVLLSFRLSHSNTLRIALTTMVYAMVEVYFLVNPTTFHIVMYWFLFIPMISLIIKGIRASQLWIGIVLLSHLFNYYFLNRTIGDSHELKVFPIS